MATMDIDTFSQSSDPRQQLSEDQELVSILALGAEFIEFADALDECLSPLLSISEKRERLLSLPQQYYENSIRRLERLRDTRVGNNEMDMDTDEVEGGVNFTPEVLGEIDRIEKETQTWNLLRLLLPLRYSDPEAEAQLTRIDNLRSTSSSMNKLNNFFKTNSIARERRAVLQWLQSNASSGPDIDDLTRDLQQSADRGDLIAHGWLHTRLEIKLKKRATGWPHLLDRQSANISKSHLTSTGAPLVTQLDPDAPTRQTRKLQPQDEYFERAVWRGCFEHLRRGSDLEIIREWCAERTELWRAVSVSSMLLSAEAGQDNSDCTVFDPASLALWRRICFGLARQGGSDDYERAVYGMLSGDISSVEKVALNWDDHLFAHYNALLRTQIDQFILGQCSPATASSLTTTFQAFDALQFHGETEGVEERLVASLESLPALKNEALEPNKALQAAIISKKVGDYLYRQGTALTSNESESNAPVPLGNGATQVGYFKANEYHGLRILAHVYVLTTLLERLDTDEHRRNLLVPRPAERSAQDNILDHYTSLLRRAQLLELIPLYCSILDPPRLYETLSASMILIKDQDPQKEADSRKSQLKLMEKAGINVLEFVKIQASLLYNKLEAERDGRFEAKESFKILRDSTSVLGKAIKDDFISGEDEDSIDPRHDHLISALEWLLLVDQTWPNVFDVATDIYKYFLRHKHLNAARQLMKRVPFAEVMKDLNWDAENDYEAKLNHVEFWSRKLQERGLDDAPETVMLDAQNFRELESLVRALDNLETVASIHEIVTSTTQVTAAESRDQFGKAIVAIEYSMGPLLEEWLLAGIRNGDKELREIRETYLPETILAYVTALNLSGMCYNVDNFLDCMQIATLIMETGSDLERLFVEAKRVRELLDVLAVSSRALAVAKEQTKPRARKVKEGGWSRDLWSVKS